MSLIILLAAAGAAGAVALHRMQLPGSVESVAFKLMVGFCLCAIVSLLLGSISLWAANLGIFLIAVIGLACELFFIKKKHRAPHSTQQSAKEPLTPLEWCGISAVALALAIGLINAFAPATSWDATVGHLALAKSYTQTGRFLGLESNAYSGYPHLLHVLYTNAYSQGGETATQLLDWVFAALACVMVYALGRQIESRQCGIVAAALFATAPLFFDQIGTVSLDIAFAGFVAGLLAALTAWWDTQRWGWLLVAAFLAGSGCGIRHTGYIVCALLAVGIILFNGPKRFRATFIFCITTVIAASPWFIRSALVAGSPVYPYLTHLFSLPTIPDAQTMSFGVHDSIRGLNIIDYLMFPWRIIMKPSMFDGWTKSPGGLLLFLGIPGLFVGGRRCWSLALFAIAGGSVLFFYQQFARYLFPFFMPMMVVAAVATCRMNAIRKPVSILVALAFCFGVSLGAMMVHFKLPVVLGMTERNVYLGLRVERYPAFVWMNENLSDDDVVLTLDPRSYYIHAQTYQNFPALLGLLDKPIEDQLEWLRERNIRYIFVPDAYLNETPFYAASGLLSMINQWREDRDHFSCIRSVQLNRARASGTERIEIYEVNDTLDDGLQDYLHISSFPRKREFSGCILETPRYCWIPAFARMMERDQRTQWRLQG